MSEDIHEVTGTVDVDGPPPGSDGWKESTQGVDRLVDVALTLDRPRSVKWIAEEAEVSEQTARDYLKRFSEWGFVAQTTARGVTQYQRDSAYLRFRAVSAYIEQYNKNELLDTIRDRKQLIEQTRERYEIESPDELRSKAADEETTSDEVVEYKKAASELETLLHDLGVLQEAVERYDEFSRASVRA